MRTFLIAGNWKMNKTAEEARAFFAELNALVPSKTKCEALICPTFTALSVVKEANKGKISLGAQNVYPKDSGAFTGEISPKMLSEFVSYVIVGHSERRTLLKETNAFINEKIHALLANHLKPILCVGESLEERKSGRAFDIIAEELTEGLASISKEQMASITIAYEPIWAIGTGETATPAIAQEVHAFIRDWLVKHFDKSTADSVRILYGGSLKASNAHDLLSQPDIDGGLIGGASLEAKSFSDIIHIADELL